MKVDSEESDNWYSAALEMRCPQGLVGSSPTSSAPLEIYESLTRQPLNVCFDSLNFRQKRTVLFFSGQEHTL